VHVAQPAAAAALLLLLLLLPAQRVGRVREPQRGPVGGQAQQAVQGQAPVFELGLRKLRVGAEARVQHGHVVRQPGRQEVVRRHRGQHPALLQRKRRRALQLLQQRRQHVARGQAGAGRAARHVAQHVEREAHAVLLQRGAGRRRLVRERGGGRSSAGAGVHQRLHPQRPVLAAAAQQLRQRAGCGGQDGVLRGGAPAGGGCGRRGGRRRAAARRWPPRQQQQQGAGRQRRLSPAAPPRRRAHLLLISSASGLADSCSASLRAASCTASASPPPPAPALRKTSSVRGSAHLRRKGG
jgi:hypothetical protein